MVWRTWWTKCKKEATTRRVQFAWSTTTRQGLLDTVICCMLVVYATLDCGRFCVSCPQGAYIMIQ